MVDEPQYVWNVIAGESRKASGDGWLERESPVHGNCIALLPDSTATDVDEAVAVARRRWRDWAELGPVSRGALLRSVAERLTALEDEIVQAVRTETGKPVADARGELGAAIEFSYFMASEGRRLYGRTIPSGVEGKRVATERVPIGVAGLIVAANTPMPNYTWKVMPALVCGNTVVLKPSEHTPLSADLFMRALREAGVPDGVVNLVHGRGDVTGRAIVVHPDVDLVSFTGGTATGREVAAGAGGRLAKVCLELGGRNPLVVCDDADLARAAEVAAASAFSNAGQRCASGSRVIVDQAVHDEFLERLVDLARALVVGGAEDADIGPVVSRASLQRIEQLVEKAVSNGAVLRLGGRRMDDEDRAAGCFMAPTVLELPAGGEEPIDDEIFGPVATVLPVDGFDAALDAAGKTPFGLTAAIHTTDMDRARAFVDRVQAGMVSINGPTYGSEPHMPFGGFRASGNGYREGGTEVLDFYSDWKAVATWGRPVR